MAKGYPGKTRARKAFWWGVRSVRRRHAFNPYQHPRLKELFDRGRTEAQLKPALLDRVPIKGNKPQRRETRSRYESRPRGPFQPRQRNPFESNDRNQGRAF